MLAIVCPGQGSQTQGFLSEWISDDASRATLDAYSQHSGTDLLTHGTVSDAETIRDTAVAQPLIVAASLLSASALDLTGANPERVLYAGHSVGEIPAAVLAGVLTPQQALAFIRVRATSMAAAAAAVPTSMAAVVGGVEDEVRQVIADAGLTPANANGPGQIVAAGELDKLAALEASPPTRARVIPLTVAGAFHTEFMDSAKQALAAAAASFEVADPRHRLISNRDGAYVSTGADVLARLVDQVTRPVRWDLCMETMAQAEVTGVLELLPGGTLTGLAKRGLKGVKSLAIKTPADIDAAQEFIAEHAG
ncbi:ACP S-malonyltransferase [Nesterenkonia sp. LB17]|uniref:ACP S-malonyltransferase n=1 Tax=unclassified Nesterenkonia TaxID=2629769 RepID=UPI001F4D10D9|nr:ACP S-malonyltransferase [Nesterenkonia sp. DZ6]MCH8562439.1 ACP S-malonyltransferase [Nesterenkonia sp. YGD6]MCH8565375.1 ACP S-malonyltransferase [Nesterenkonia sp. LB17]MCH8571293.1 ACP S-malonyltransferase [Nesterenkonia sp. AY15]